MRGAAPPRAPSLCEILLHHQDGRALGEYRVSRDATLHLALRLRGGGGDGGVVATQRRYMRSTFKNSYKSRAGAKGANYGAGATGGDEETCGSVDPRLIARFRCATCALSDEPLDAEHEGAIVADELGNLYNKTLKDIINRYKLLQGFRIHYVPGFDCFGANVEDAFASLIEAEAKVDAMDLDGTASSSRMSS